MTFFTGITYQMPCISDVCIAVHKRSKIVTPERGHVVKGYSIGKAAKHWWKGAEHPRWCVENLRNPGSQVPLLVS